MVELLFMLNQQRLTLQIREKLMDHLRATQGALMAAPHHAWEVIGLRPGRISAVDGRGRSIRCVILRRVPAVLCTGRKARPAAARQLGESSQRPGRRQERRAG